MKTKSIYLTVALGLMLGFASCDMDYYPSDEQSSDIIMKEASSTIIDGCYALMKDEIEYLGWPSGNSYCRHYFQMAEFPADNTCISGQSTDPLFNAGTYTMTDDLQNVGTLWMVGYKIINMANTLIENLKSDNADNKQILGEAYFVRALIHLNMVTLFAKPYSYGRDNMGVPLMTSSISTVVKRHTVGEVYDQIVDDLKQAASLMDKSRGNAGYASKDAALGLLSRVYLYMEQYNDCIETVNTMLGGSGLAYIDASSKLDANIGTYFANAKSSKETLFCIAHETTDDRVKSSIGSMYNADGNGWGEIYPSFPLLNLYERYPMDKRYAELIVPQYPASGPSKALKVYIPLGDKESVNMRALKEFDVKYDSLTHLYTFTMDGVKRTVDTVAGSEYTEYHVDNNGEDLVVRIMPKNINKRNSYPKYFVTKFGYQDGSATLSSPVVLRWAEMILNRAEAYARLTGYDKEALDDVNVIRNRAGIPTAGLFSTTNMHGYTSVIDVVMDERRLELAFEGHRMFDVYRNKLNMDRRFPGFQEWKVVKADFTEEPHILYPIPNAEWTVSHIQQNDGY